MLGYDAVRLHAAVNDLPAALLVASVLFDLLGTLLKRDTLRTAGFWTLLAGVLGGAAAVISGLVAEEGAAGSGAAHGVLETHETLAFIVLAMFALLAAWRLVRRGAWSEKEQPIALTAGVIGVALMVVTGAFGGKLVFEHAVGIPTPVLESVARSRQEAPPAAPAALPEAAPPATPSDSDTVR